MTVVTIFQYTEAAIVLENVISLEYNADREEVAIQTDAGFEPPFSMEDVMRIELSHGKE